jgi:hypothetical protein
VAVAFIMLMMASITLAFSLFMYSDAQKFAQLTGMFRTLNGYAFVFAPLLGLFVVSSHLRNKQIKIVVTKPCSPETWLASCLLSAALMSAAVYALILVLVLAASLAWGIPLQSGFLFGAVREFCVAMVALAFIVPLATLVHPVAAALIALFFEEKVWYGMKFMLTAYTTSGHPGLATRVGNWVVNGIYYAVPMFDPFNERVEHVYRSMRASGGDWLYVLYTAGYAVAAGLFCYLLSSRILRRRALV